MTSFRVNVQPSVLVWARESVRLSQEEAAKKIGVGVERLQAWEEGRSSPTYRQLQTVAEKYRRPVAVLYLQSPPKHFDALKNYRRVLEQAGIELSYQLVTEFERIRMQQDVMQEIYELDDRPLPSLGLILRSSMPTETAARSLRGWLELPVDQQRRWARTDQFVPRLSELIEDRGILVTQIQRVDIGVMRGCAIPDHAFPAIVLNGADTRSAKVFTLIHEVVHVLLYASGEAAVIPITPERTETTTEVERFCNAVAAATLMPEEVMLGVASSSSLGPNGSWTIGRLEAMSRDLGVSPQSYMLRLIALNRASWDDYAALRSEFDVRRPTESTVDPSPIHYPLKVRDLGRRYIREVAAAYARRDISTSEIADYLQIKIDKLPKLLGHLPSVQP